VFGLFKKKKECPKCDSKNIKEVKPDMWAKARAAYWNQPKILNVCRDCGFSWEDR
jgi:predicted Zn-ribbon and HTH transcriptional regulator